MKKKMKRKIFKKSIIRAMYSLKKNHSYYKYKLFLITLTLYISLRSLKIYVSLTIRTNLMSFIKRIVYAMSKTERVFEYLVVSTYDFENKIPWSSLIISSVSSNPSSGQ